MSPLDAAWHDFADADPDASVYEAFAAGWLARAAEADRLVRAVEQMTRLLRVVEQLAEEVSSGSRR